MHFESLRNQDFPTLQNMTYLNTAAEGIPPRCVLDALRQYGEDKLMGMDARELHEEQRRRAQDELALAYGLTPTEVSFCSCSSEAYNLAAMALRLQEGDEVIINDLDFPAGATPWMQPTCPATVRVWRSRAGALHVEDLVPLLGPKTRLVATSLVSFYNGHMILVDQVASTVRRHSPALLALDVTQALGRIPLDLSDADLIVSSTHKWILASHGGGLVGVPSSRAQQFTTHAGGWFHLENAFEADRFQHAVTKAGAASFSVGMPNYSAIYAIHAALSYIRHIGVDAINAHARPLTLFCLEGLRRLDLDLLTPDDPDRMAGILAFQHPRAEQIHQRLHEREIHIMSHAGRLRIAVHFYNTRDDIERFLTELQAALKAE